MVRCRNCGMLHLKPDVKCRLCGTRFALTKMLGHRGVERMMKQKARDMPDRAVQDYARQAQKTGVGLRTPRDWRNFLPEGKDHEPTVERR